MTIRLVSPKGQPTEPTGGDGERPRPAARPQTLDDVTLGLLWNTKVNGDRLMHELAALLQQRYRLEEVLFRAKPALGAPAPAAIIDEFGQRCGAVITAVGD